MRPNSPYYTPDKGAAAMPKVKYVRVKDKNSRGEYTVASHAVREHHEVLDDKPAIDPTGQPLPPKPFVPKGAGKKSSAPAASQSKPEEPAESKEG